MFEDGAIVDRFIQAWRTSGKQVSVLLCFVTMVSNIIYYSIMTLMTSYNIYHVTKFSYWLGCT